MSSKVSLLYVDYRKAKRLSESVASALAQEGDFELEVLIADNSEDSGNWEWVKGGMIRNKCCIGRSRKQAVGSREVWWERNEKNLGYTRANNRLAEKATGDYLFFLNPDIVFSKPDVIQNMIKYFDQNKEVGILGPKQINPDGGVALTVRPFPDIWTLLGRRSFLRRLPIVNNKIDQYEMKGFDWDEISEVDWLQSSAIMMPREVWMSLQGFSEKYFLFMADIDLCKRCHDIGKKVVYYPLSEVSADGLRASRGSFWRFFTSWTVRQHCWDALRYFMMRSRRS